MVSRGERRLIGSLIVFVFWFFLSTLYLLKHISSSVDLHDAKTSFETAFSSFIHAKHSYDNHRQVDQIYFETNEEVDAAINKIPFPQSIKNEKMERIIHPAVEMMSYINSFGRNSTEVVEEDGNIDYSEKDDKILMVPKFYNPPSFKNGVRTFLGNYGERLMTPEEAKAIGSYTMPLYSTNDGYDYSNQNGINKQRNVALETIFVTIASYRDYRCPRTLRQIFLQATYPERIRVAIVDQLKPNEDTNCAKPDETCTASSNDALCKYSHLIDVYEMDASMAVGPVLARHIGGRMYRGEYFAMQSDAHMEFVKGWDVEIIRQWKSAKNEMAVLTTYVSDVNGHYDMTTGRRTTNTRPKMCVTDFDPDYYDNRLTNLMHGQQPEGKPDVTGEPTLHPFWAAGLSFSRGHFLIQVPYDQYLPMIFQGEEINIGLRGFTYGYDYYAPEHSVIFHYYSNGGKDKKVKTFWENSDAYNGLEQASMARLLGITELLPTKTPKVKTIDWYSKEDKKYGLGKVRTVQKFLQTFGINIVTKTVQHHLCRFVGMPMNTMFLRNLRENGMGIDYDQISFQFKDPDVHGQSWSNNADDQGAWNEK